MITLTFAEVYETNKKGNRIFVDKASFTDANRAHDFIRLFKASKNRNKFSYFIGIHDEQNETLRSIFSLLPDQLKVLKEEAREDIKMFIETMEIA